MKPLLLLALATLTLGCASKSQTPLTLSNEPYTAAKAPKAQSASALVYDIPLSTRQPQLDLSRDGRQPSAYIGYETGVATYFYLRADDRQSDSMGDQVERRSYTAKTGVTYR